MKALVNGDGGDYSRDQTCVRLCGRSGLLFVVGWEFKRRGLVDCFVGRGLLACLASCLLVKLKNSRKDMTVLLRRNRILVDIWHDFLLPNSSALPILPPKKKTPDKQHQRIT